MNEVLGVVTALAGMISTIVNHYQQKELMKYVDELTDLKLKIMEEETKYPNCDDAKIETLLQKIEVITNAAQNQLIVSLSNPNNPK